MASFSHDLELEIQGEATVFIRGWPRLDGGAPHRIVGRNVDDVFRLKKRPLVVVTVGARSVRR